MGALIFFFTIWSNVLLVNYDRLNLDFMVFWEVCTSILALYFVFLQILNQYKTKVTFKRTYGKASTAFTLKYFIMQGSPIFVFGTIMYARYLGIDNLNEAFWIISAWASLMIWSRFLLYLQSTQTMSFVISMILACATEMTAFLLLLFIGILAFADGIKSIRQILYTGGTLDRVVNLETEPKGFIEFMSTYFGEWHNAMRTTYYISIGDFDADEMNQYSFWAWPVFFWCTIFNIIILLNLLIAIVNDIFNRVMTKRLENRYKLMCSQISLC